MNFSSIISFLEYLILLILIYTLFNNNSDSMIYIALLGFFLFSGSAWVLGEIEVFKEYKKYSLYLQVIAVLISLLFLLYVWLK